MYLCLFHGQTWEVGSWEHVNTRICAYEPGRRDIGVWGCFHFLLVLWLLTAPEILAKSQRGLQKFAGDSTLKQGLTKASPHQPTAIPMCQCLKLCCWILSCFPFTYLLQKNHPMKYVLFKQRLWSASLTRDKHMSMGSSYICIANLILLLNINKCV